ncbi:MAG: DUF1902 domain-containing protein [Candidatus Binataceae bacterium]
MRSRAYVIKAVWDPEAEVWVAESDDVPGLITGAPTIDALIDKLHVLIPELLELNGKPAARKPKPLFELLASKDRERFRLYADA